MLSRCAHFPWWQQRLCPVQVKVRLVQWEESTIGHNILYDIVYDMRYNRQHQTITSYTNWDMISLTSNQLMLCSGIGSCLYHVFDLHVWPHEVTFLVESVLPMEWEGSPMRGWGLLESCSSNLAYQSRIEQSVQIRHSKTVLLWSM